LLAGEDVDMPLLFFIDKDILDDPACRGIDDVVLSYTFFRCVSFSYILNFPLSNRLCVYRARRNAQGHLEPDASDKDVQKSLGLENYEMAPRAEIRNAQAGKSS
jgi:cytochrome c oxidase assembly protein subunit 11